VSSMPLSQITKIPDALGIAELTPANDNSKSTILSMDSSEEGSLLNESHYNPKVEGVPLWQAALILFCISAVAAALSFGLLVL
jgi:hypothetical protein